MADQNDTLPEGTDSIIAGASATTREEESIVKEPTVSPSTSAGGKMVEKVKAGGGKLSGEYAGFGIGGLSVYTDRTETAPGQLLSAFRITRPVLEQSRLGFIFLGSWKDGSF